MRGQCLISFWNQVSVRRVNIVKSQLSLRLAKRAAEECFSLGVERFALPIPSSVDAGTQTFVLWKHP